MSRVFKVASLGAPHNHHASFVETNAGGSGTFLQIMGDIYNGMGFEEKTTERLENPSNSPTRRSLAWLWVIITML